ncbi:MAG: hypothetical protein ACI39R_06840 [Lachnospiraceae bacterium]
MAKVIVLTPDELYYMGKVMHAKYIDYAYISAIKSIEVPYEIYMKEIRYSLIDKEIIDKYSGDDTPDKDVAALLNPIFFGTFEASLDIYVTKDEGKIQVYKFHALDGAITMVTPKEDSLLIQAVDIPFIEALIKGVMPSAACDMTSESLYEISKEDVLAVYSFKRSSIGKFSDVRTLLKVNGRLYERICNGEYSCINENMRYFITDEMIKEA